MITTDQIKAAIDRVEALYKYLNIEEKKIQLEEEELKTQAPEFWQDQKRAEAQMKLVKGIKFWIEGYNTVNAAVNEVQIAYDFYKEEAMTEAEVDEADSRQKVNSAFIVKVRIHFKQSFLVLVFNGFCLLYVLIFQLSHSYSNNSL